MKLGLTYLLAPSARPTASPAIFPPLSPRLASPRPSSPSSLRSWLLNRVGRDRWSKKLEATVGNSLTRAQNRSAASELCQRDISEIAVTPESLWWLNDSVLLSLPSPSSFPRNSWSIKGKPDGPAFALRTRMLKLVFSVRGQLRVSNSFWTEVF